MKSNQNYIVKNKSRSVRDLFLLALKHFKKNDCNLAIDFGCGLGTETAYLASRKPWRILAIDHDPELLKMAKLRMNSLGNSAVEFSQSTFESIKEIPNCDFFYCYHSLHFCQKYDYDRLWSMIIKSLNPGGILAISVFGETDFLVKKGQAVGITEEEIHRILTGFKMHHFKNVKEQGPEQLDFIEVIAEKT